MYFSGSRSVQTRMVLLTVVFPLFVLGCGIHLFDKPPRSQAIVLNANNYTCVSQISKYVGLYVDDQLSEQEINSFVRCLQKSFIAFGRLTRGRDQATYSPDEIRRFIEMYFLHERKISDELLHEFMVIKQTLVGGDIDRISRPDLANAVTVLDEIGKEAIRLKPHIKYLNYTLAAKQDQHDMTRHLDEAGAALHETIDVFSQRLRNGKQDYPMENLQKFIEEFRKFSNWENQFSGTRPVAQWIELLKAFKSIEVSPDTVSVIRPDEWQPMLTGFAHWYIDFLQYSQGIRGQSVLEGPGLQNLFLLGRDVFASIEHAITVQPTKTITFGQIHDLMAALHNAGILPTRLRVSSLDSAVQAAVNRIFGDRTVAPANRHGLGVTMRTVTNVESDFYRWSYLQMQLKGDSGAQGGSDWDEFMKVKSLIQPLYRDGSPRVVLVPPPLKIEPDPKQNKYGLYQSFYNLSLMNVMRSIVTLVFQGYASDQGSDGEWSAGLTADEVQSFYLDFRPLGIDLNIVDRRNLKSGLRSFTEAKLFTYASRGISEDAPRNAELSLEEGIEYLGFLYSGGQIASGVYSDALANCPHGTVDITGEERVDRACVVRRLPQMMTLLMSNMPLLQDYLNGVDARTRQRFAQIVVDTAKTPNSDVIWLEHGEINVFCVIVSYIEAVMTRYDSNLDGKLENPEIEMAYPIFSGFIKEIADRQFPSWLQLNVSRGAFYYILDFKEIPGAPNLPRVEWFQKSPSMISLDRLALAQVFKAIIEQLMESGPNTVISVQ